MNMKFENQNEKTIDGDCWVGKILFIDFKSDKQPVETLRLPEIITAGLIAYGAHPERAEELSKSFWLDNDYSTTDKDFNS